MGTTTNNDCSIIAGTSVPESQRDAANDIVHPKLCPFRPARSGDLSVLPPENRKSLISLTSTFELSEDDARKALKPQKKPA